MQEYEIIIDDRESDIPMPHITEKQQEQFDEYNKNVKYDLKDFMKK